MSELALQVVERSVSVPGVQPKLSMTLITDNKTDRRLTVVGALGGNYNFKPPSEYYAEMPANEHLTMKMVELFGIDSFYSWCELFSISHIQKLKYRNNSSPIL